MEKIQCEVWGKEVRGCLYLKGNIVEKNPRCFNCSYFKKLKKLNVDPDKIRRDGRHWVYEELFTRIPPDGSLDQSFLKSQAYIPRSQIDFDEFAHMKMPLDQFIKTKNAVYGFQGFMAAIECGYYPPFSILSWLVAAFKKYLDSNGAEDLMKLLGIRGKQKQGNAFKQIQRADRDIRLVGEIFRLTKKGVRPKEAAQRVAKSKKLNPEGLGWITIQNKYSQLKNIFK